MADEYIKRKVLLQNKYIDSFRNFFDCQNYEAIVKCVPAADVAPVVHGEWRVIDRTEYGLEAECSECGYKMIFGRCQIGKFCPNCGAKMDGGNE